MSTSFVIKVAAQRLCPEEEAKCRAAVYCNTAQTKWAFKLGYLRALQEAGLIYWGKNFWCWKD
jgi:hypothetical protein